MAAQLMPLIVVVLFAILLTFWQRQYNKNYDYQCTNCGSVFSIDPIQAVIAPHSFGKKYVRCPHCGQMTWAVPVPRGD